MSDLEQATQIVERLRSVIETELVQARGQRLLIRALDTPGLFERARQRSAFNVQLAQLEQELAKALAAVGQALGLSELTLTDLRQISPQGAQRLDHSLAEVRVLTEALREIDSINRKLGERALGRVRRTLSAMVPRPVAYDRRGAHQPMEALSTASRVA